MPRKKGAVSGAPAVQAPDPLATPQEVADYLRKPVRTLTEWRYRGIGPEYLKVGTDIRYDWSDVKAWLAQLRHETVLDPGPAA